MRRSRRHILGTIGAVSMLGLAGCPSEGISYSTPGGSSDGETATATATPTPPGTPEPTETPTETPEPTETPTETPTPSQVDPLRADTEQAFSEVEWFATRYAGEVTRALGLAGRIHDMLRNLRRTPALTERDRRRIESATGEYETLLGQVFAPHFPTERVRDIVEQSREQVAAIRRFSERGDTDRAEEELSELAGLYDRLRTRSEFERTFPDFPIRSPLLEYLTAEPYDDSTPLSFVIGYPAESYTTLVRAEGDWETRTVQTTSISDRDLENHFANETAIFTGLDASTRRTGRLFVNVHLSRTSPEHVPLYLQRYADAGWAERARSSLLSGIVSREGTVDIGRTTWERVFYVATIPVSYTKPGYLVRDGEGNVIYDEDGRITEDTGRTTTRDTGGSGPEERGDVVYTYLSQIGNYLIAAAPSVTAWEQRPDGSNDPLKQTWLFE